MALLPPASANTLSSDELLMGEILLSLKRDAIKAEPPAGADSYRNKVRLSVEVASPSSSSADVFSFDAFASVSPLAARVPLRPSPHVASPRHGGPRRYGPVVQLDDLRQCFNMPIAAVARKFGICATLLKKICRRHGIQRWPHRQIRSLQKSIDMLRESLSVAKGSNKEYIAKKIAAFEYTLECIMQDPNTAAKGISAGRLASPASEEMVKRGNRARSRKKAAAATAQPLSDDEETASGTGASPIGVEAVKQDWASVAEDAGAPGPSAQRLATRRASVPMSLQSILC